MSDQIGHLVLDNSSATKLDSVAQEEGMLSLMQDGYLRVLEGITTLEEVMRVAKS